MFGGGGKRKDASDVCVLSLLIKFFYSNSLSCFKDFHDSPEVVTLLPFVNSRSSRGFL